MANRTILRKVSRNPAWNMWHFLDVLRAARLIFSYPCAINGKGEKENLHPLGAEGTAVVHHKHWNNLVLSENSCGIIKTCTNLTLCSTRRFVSRCKSWFVPYPATSLSDDSSSRSLNEIEALQEHSVFVLRLRMPMCPICTCWAVSLSTLWCWGLPLGSAWASCKAISTVSQWAFQTPDSLILFCPSVFPPVDLPPWVFSQHPPFYLLETEIVICLPPFLSCFSKAVQSLQTFLPVSQLCLLFEYVGRGGDLKQTSKQTHKNKEAAGGWRTSSQRVPLAAAFTEEDASPRYWGQAGVGGNLGQRHKSQVENVPSTFPASCQEGSLPTAWGDPVPCPRQYVWLSSENRASDLTDSSTKLMVLVQVSSAHCLKEVHGCHCFNSADDVPNDGEKLRKKIFFLANVESVQ